MTIVVTGSAGFLGRVVVRQLVAEGHEVVGIDRRPVLTAAHAEQHAETGIHAGTRTEIHADLLAGDAAATAALAAAEAVIHLAGCPGVRDGRADIGWHRHRDNVLTTAAVLAAAGRRTRVVAATSSSVYGGSVGGRACTEDDPLRPRGGYAASKAAAEALCAGHNAAGGNVIVARPFTVAGEGQRPDMALALWIAAARAGRPLRVLGGVERTRDITDVRDAARVLIALTEVEASGPVNIGTGTPVRLGDMVAAVAAALDVDVDVRIEPAGPEEVPDTRADTRRLAALVGFVPVTDLAAVVNRQSAAATPEPARASA